MALPNSPLDTVNPSSPIVDTAQGGASSGVADGTINGVDGINNDGQYILDTDAATPAVAAGDGDDYIELGQTGGAAGTAQIIDGNAGDDNIIILGSPDSGGGPVGQNLGGAGSDSITIDAALNDYVMGHSTAVASNTGGATEAADGADTITVTDATGSHVAGNNGDDVFTIGTSFEVIAGGDGNDSIDAEITGQSNFGGEPSIYGNAGNDTITVDDVFGDLNNADGGTGDDVIEATNIIAGSTILGGDDNDSITVSGTDLSIGGGSSLVNDASDGNDTITVTDSTIVELDASNGDDVINVTNTIGNAAGDITGGYGDDTFNLDGTGGTLDVVVEGGIDSGHDTVGANGQLDTFNITVDGAEDSVYLGGFTDQGTGDVYDAATDDILIINGETFDWGILADGDVSGSAAIASITNSAAGTPGSTADNGQVTITTTDGATIVVDNLHVACFVTGTSIATAAGDVAVETLAIGDMVTTADGNTAPVKWIGRREVSSVFAAKNASVQPILITEGALGNGLPTADLRVSPDHAMFVDGVLIHAEALVNGSTIVQEAIAETFTYFHIELDNHDLVLANGAPAETFVDSDVRARFDNAAEYVALYGTAESAAPMALPRVKSKRQLPAALKAKLA